MKLTRTLLRKPTLQLEDADFAEADGCATNHFLSMISGDPDPWALETCYMNQTDGSESICKSDSPFELRICASIPMVLIFETESTSEGRNDTPNGNWRFDSVIEFQAGPVTLTYVMVGRAFFSPEEGHYVGRFVRGESVFHYDGMRNGGSSELLSGTSPKSLEGTDADIRPRLKDGYATCAVVYHLEDGTAGQKTFWEVQALTLLKSHKLCITPKPGHTPGPVCYIGQEYVVTPAEDLWWADDPYNARYDYLTLRQAHRLPTPDECNNRGSSKPQPRKRKRQDGNSSDAPFPKRVQKARDTAVVPQKRKRKDNVAPVAKRARASPPMTRKSIREMLALSSNKGRRKQVRFSPEPERSRPSPAPSPSLVETPPPEKSLDEKFHVDCRCGLEKHYTDQEISTLGEDLVVCPRCENWKHQACIPGGYHRGKKIDIFCHILPLIPSTRDLSQAWP